MEKFFKKNVIHCKIIKNKKGNIIKIISNKKTEDQIKDVYISLIKFNKIKAWKMHLKMNCNLLVIRGKVKFVILKKIKQKIKFLNIVMSDKKPSLLKIKSGLWFGFKGLSKKPAAILNFSNRKHFKKDNYKKNINHFKCNWK